MANLTGSEKRRFEKLFRLDGGYVFDFSNRTFAKFVEDSTGIDIYEPKYDYGSGPKANRLREFWTVETNYVVAKLLGDLIAYGQEMNAFENDVAYLIDECRKAITRLSQEHIVAEINSLVPNAIEKDF